MANIEDLRDRSVSSGTLKSEDLIPKFLGVLKTYGKDKYDKYIKENPEVEDWENLDEETMGWVVDELTDLLNEIAPDGCYFGASEGDGADFGFWSMSNESKKSEVSSLAAFDIEDVVGKKLGWTWDDDKSCLVDKDGTEVGWDESDCITIDPVEDENGNVLTQVNMWGDGTVEFQDENGESVNWTEFDDATVKKVVAVLGGKSEAKKSEAYEDIWRGAQVVSYEDATDYIALPADEEQKIIDKYGEDYYDNPDAMDEYAEVLDDYIVSMFDQDFVSIDGEEIPLGLCREPKVLIVQDIDHTGGDKAIELVKKLANGKLTGSSDDGDYVAIMDGVNGSPHFDIYSEGGKSEGNDDDKGCKGKDCKDDKTKKNEADATFKVGDFVSYEAGKDGKDSYDAYVYCEVIGINDDGTLDLCPFGTDANTDGIGDNANPAYCEKLDHFAGMVDAHHYYMDGKYNAYKGGWEILITDKELNPKVYEFIGTIDDLSEVIDIDDYYGGENFVFDEDLKDEVATNTGWDVETTTFADMTGDVGESKQTEGLPPKKLGNRLYRSRADLINKMKTLDAVEITTPAQFNDIHSKQWLHTAGYAMDINGNLVGQTYFGDKDGKWYYATTKTFQGDYLPECKQNEASPDVATIEGLKSLLGSGIAVAGNELRCKGVWKLNSKNPKQHQWTFVGDNGSISVKTDDDFKVIRIWGDLNKKSFDLGASENKEEAKKSESLTLKQKELKDMARFGQAEDITTISDEEAKALRKKGIETIGVSRGTYGMNGALLRDNEGKKYVITARSSNLFYFV